MSGNKYLLDTNFILGILKSDPLVLAQVPDLNEVTVSTSLELPVARFLHTLEIVAKEEKHLSYSWNSLFNQTISDLNENLNKEYLDETNHATYTGHRKTCTR